MPSASSRRARRVRQSSSAPSLARSRSRPALASVPNPRSLPPVASRRRLVARSRRLVGVRTASLFAVAAPASPRRRASRRPESRVANPASRSRRRPSSSSRAAVPSRAPSRARRWTPRSIPRSTRARRRATRDARRLRRRRRAANRTIRASRRLSNDRRTVCAYASIVALSHERSIEGHRATIDRDWRLAIRATRPRARASARRARRRRTKGARRAIAVERFETQDARRDASEI